MEDPPDSERKVTNFRGETSGKVFTNQASKHQMWWDIQNKNKNPKDLGRPGL